MSQKQRISFRGLLSSDSSTTSGPDDEDITSEVRFQLILDKFLTKTRPRPKVINGNPLWKRILSEHAHTAWHAMKQEDTSLLHGIDTKEWLYLNKEIFPTLLPAIEETMNLAKSLKVEEGKFRAFNYLDSLIHYMLNLNLNPDEPIRMIEDIEEIKEHLEKFPKPSLPKHKIWSRHKAATLIQRNVRGWLVRKRPEVAEMRQFWKVIREEHKTRKSPVIPRPLIPHISDLLSSGGDYSSSTEATIYNDEKQYFRWKKDDDENGKLGHLTFLGLSQKPQKSHARHLKNLSQREKSRPIDSNLREAMVQTEPMIYRSDLEGKNPFERMKARSRRIRANGSHHPKRKSKAKPIKSEICECKLEICENKPEICATIPEISNQEIDVAISFQDLKDKNNMK